MARLEFEVAHKRPPCTSNNNPGRSDERRFASAIRKSAEPFWVLVGPVEMVTCFVELEFPLVRGIGSLG